MGKDEIEAAFPGLIKGGFSITSPSTADYNCIAWAAADTGNWWDPHPDYFWPSGIPRKYSVEAYIRAYETLGYTLCSTADYEQGYEKIAIYVNPDGEPTHAARQLESGHWTSKLGQIEDIEHETLAGVEGKEYGSATAFMKRLKN